jgi:hypothetical protein
LRQLRSRPGHRNRPTWLTTGSTANRSWTGSPASITARRDRPCTPRTRSSAPTQNNRAPQPRDAMDSRIKSPKARPSAARGPHGTTSMVPIMWCAWARI